MNVVPFKRYSYLEWLRISALNNNLRRDKGKAETSNDDISALWTELFPRLT